MNKKPKYKELGGRENNRWVSQRAKKKGSHHKEIREERFSAKWTRSEERLSSEPEPDATNALDFFSLARDGASLKK